MKVVAKVGITLLIIAGFAAAALAVVNAITAPKIAEYEIQVLKNALLEVSGDLEVGTTIESVDLNNVKAVHTLLNEQDQVSGYILQLQGVGYGGPMTLMAGYLLNGEVIDVRLLSNSETPGLGKKAETVAYMQKFVGTGGANKEVPVKANMLDKKDADDISGSTVTFSGVAKAIALGSDYVKSLGVN
ncbi:MAG: FMN-binding protein [Sphaerochaetaceae bacterium]|jgi:electron transport complex protein RnfG